MDREYRREMNRRNPMNIQMNSTDEQELPKYPNAALADLLMQMRKPNMRIEQINGQRRYGPPADHIGPPPPNGCEVFVGKIPSNVFELELAPIFEKIGKVYEIRIMMNFSGQNRGFGFVRYYTPEEADDAVFILDNYEIRQNVHLGVTKSVDNCLLYITKIPHEKNGDEILEELNGVGLQGVTRVIATSGGGCGGVAFVDFENHRTASIARRSMMLEEIRLWENVVHGEWALPEPETQFLFVRNLAEVTSGNQLIDLFNANSGHGVRRISKMETTAYISFHTPAQAQHARCALDKSTLDGHRIDVLTVHGDEEMMPNDNSQIFQDQHDIPCEIPIPGCQQFLEYQPFATVPIVPAPPKTHFNPGYQFLPVTAPEIYQGPPLFIPIPSMMRMTSNGPTANYENDEDKPIDFNDLNQFEEWCELNEE